MTLEQEINQSMASEKAAANFYAAVSTLTDDAGIKDFLRGLAEQERRHARSLEKRAFQWYKPTIQWKAPWSDEKAFWSSREKTKKVEKT